MKNKLYHVSYVGGLDYIEPRVSTHGKAWVYATRNYALGLLFGSNKGRGDLDGDYGINTKDNKPFFNEAYEGALKRRFEGCSCYVYEVEDTNFEEGKTSFCAELVSEKPAKVLSCKKVENLYEEIQKLIEKNEIHFHEYSINEDYQKYIKKHLKDRIVRYKVLEDKTDKRYLFCKEKFPEILEEVENELKVE